jgi:Tfp pilus assembly protein PilF
VLLGLAHSMLLPYQFVSFPLVQNLPGTPDGGQTSTTAHAPSVLPAVAVQQWLASAESQFEHNDYKEALFSCNTALQIDPQNSDAILLKSKIENTLKILGTEATAEQQSASQLANLQRWLELAASQFEHNDYKEALFSCNNALRIDPQNSDAILLKEKIEKTMKILGDTP